MMAGTSGSNPWYAQRAPQAQVPQPMPQNQARPAPQAAQRPASQPAVAQARPAPAPARQGIGQLGSMNANQRSQAYQRAQTRMA